MGFFESPSPESPSESDEHARLGPTRSRFTYRHLSQLASSSVTCPLRVIAHIDLDAFYAQCETVRLGIPEDKPLAVQQWLVALLLYQPPIVSALAWHPLRSTLLIRYNLSAHAVPESSRLLKQ